jgi:hypothetical protein
MMMETACLRFSIGQAFKRLAILQSRKSELYLKMTELCGIVSRFSSDFRLVFFFLDYRHKIHEKIKTERNVMGK